MTERQWGIRRPDHGLAEVHSCRFCGETFKTTDSRLVYCAKHRTPKYHQLVYYAEHEKHRTFVCAGCGQTVTVKTGAGSPRKYCFTCKETRPTGKPSKGEVGGSSWKLTHISENALGTFSPDYEIAIKPTAWDDEYARIEDEYLAVTDSLLRDLRTGEIMYGASVTEHHQNPFHLGRLEAAIENVSEARIEKERLWAKERCRHGVTPRDYSSSS